MADPPRQDDDEAGYWTRVLELAAVTCEVVRARSGGQWEVAHHADLPFGFLTNLGGSGKTMPAGAPGPGGVILATNRAHRFIADESFGDHSMHRFDAMQGHLRREQPHAILGPNLCVSKTKRKNAADGERRKLFHGFTRRDAGKRRSQVCRKVRPGDLASSNANSPGTGSLQDTEPVFRRETNHGR